MKKTTTNKKFTLKKVLPYILLIAGIVGLIASFTLTYDKIQVLKNPAYSPACNLSPILSCGSVMKTEQASLLGVPNTVFGLMGFSALIAMALVLLTGSTIHRRMWQAINVGALAGFGFFIYLFFEGVYRLNTICPYCFTVWLIMPPVLWYTTLYNISEGNIKFSFINQRMKYFLRRHHGDVLVLWYILFFGVLTIHFWYYWKILL